ncbi:hypothetical protein [Cupriavidus necator]|uniref:hypothetical protein n=1 Tax=Cupriavidus necator TaxID=106590 RepID=UPI0011D1A52D|nr:hypothetical protein [Cupriavidus necator]MDX6007757.1 hypothetical protein [Cupriavidus necator]
MPLAYRWVAAFFASVSRTLRTILASLITHCQRTWGTRKDEIEQEEVRRRAIDRNLLGFRKIWFKKENFFDTRTSAYGDWISE